MIILDKLRQLRCSLGVVKSVCGQDEVIPVGWCYCRQSVPVAAKEAGTANSTVCTINVTSGKSTRSSEVRNNVRDGQLAYHLRVLVVNQSCHVRQRMRAAGSRNLYVVVDEVD